MQWNLAHRPRTEQEAIFVDVEAPDSASAITALRDRIPTDHVILFVRRIYPEYEGLPAATGADTVPASEV